MELKLQAEKREGTGKGVAHRIRAEGRVPGVVYGAGVKATPITVDARELLRVFHTDAGTNVLVDIELDGKTLLAIPREVQRDHIHSRFVHVDFFTVRRDEKVTMSTEVVETGEAPGVRAGGVVEHHLREVQIECLPSAMPERLEIDISALDIGDMLKVGDIRAPGGVTILTDPDTPVLSVITPAALRTELELELPGEEAPEAEVEEVAPAPAEPEEAPAEPEGGGEG